MKIAKRLLLVSAVMFTYACSHPLEIRGKGEGDIDSSSGTRDCSYADYQAEATNCTKNNVVFDYDETYTGVPAAGSQFRRWGSYCRMSLDNTCSFNYSAAEVQQAWFKTVPALQAVFRPLVNPGFVTVLMGNESFDPIAAGLDGHAQGNGFAAATTTRFQANGDDGAPEALWNDVVQRAAIQSVLDAGDVDVVGMTWSPTYPSDQGYEDWMLYALQQNPDTRFFVSVPWPANPAGLSAAQFASDYAANEAAVHALVDTLRERFPRVDIYSIPTGASAVDLYALFDASNLPDVTGLVGAAADSVFSSGTGEPGDILTELAGLHWVSAIYGVDLSSYTYAPSFITDLKVIADGNLDDHPLLYRAPPEVLPDADGDGIPDRFEPIELTDLLPAATRGIFQVKPGDGAVGAAASGADWHMGALQLLTRFSGGMDIAGSARRLLLAQMGDDPREFLLLAALAGEATFASVTNGIALTPTAAHLGYSLWSIAGTDLEVAQLNSVHLAVGSRAMLESALDVLDGGKPGIDMGPFGFELAALSTPGYANAFIYGLPAQAGPVTSPGDGTASLTQATAVNAIFNLDGDTLSGALNFFTPNATTYSSRLDAVLDGYDAPPQAGFSNILAVNLNDLSATDDVLPLLRTLLQDMDAVEYTDAVIEGGNNPWLNFTVDADPSSIYISYEFAGATERAAFEAAHLPPGFTLEPIRVLESDTPKYILILNIYQSSGGLVTGARAEWSAFVTDPDTGVPRYLVVQAAAAAISADSVNLLTNPEPVTHELTPTSIDSYVGIVDEVTEIESTYFQSSIVWPQVPQTLAPFAREFAVANDFIYWGNAVADHTLFNASVHNRPGVLISNSDITITDNSPWAAFVNPAPIHTVVYTGPLDIVISPWWNFDAPYLDVTPSFLTTLINFKNNFYPGLVQGLARDNIRGEGLVLTPGQRGISVPTAQYHFPVTDTAGLLGAAGAGAYTPMALALFDGEAAGHYLTLSVYGQEDDACGVRVEWSTYVDNGSGQPMTLELDAGASEPCFDTNVFMTPALDITHGISGSWLDTEINTPFLTFDATTDLSLAIPLLASLDHIEAGDWTCSLAGVCDSGYYGEGIVTAPADVADGIAVSITMSTPWDAFIDAAGVRVGVRDEPYDQAFNLSRNLRPYAAPAPAP